MVYRDEYFQDSFFGPPAVARPLMVSGAGVHLTDVHGRRYLDASSGPVVANIGHGNERVADALAHQARTLSFTSPRTTRHGPNAEFVARLIDLAGPPFDRAYLCSGGSDAMEAAVTWLRAEAVARGDASRTRVISCRPSYHGGTLAALAWSGDATAAAVYGPLAAPPCHIPAPLTYRPAAGTTAEDSARASVSALESAISDLGPENVLAFVFEPVGGVASGANVPHPLFFTRAREICDAAGVSIVHDEVMSASRTGRFLAGSHWADARPDLVALAKGLGAGYAPLAAILAPSERVDALAAAGGYTLGHTYNANPIACAAGVAVLDEIREEGLLGNAEVQGNRLRRGLESLMGDHELIGDVRGRGLLLAVELVLDRDRRTVPPARMGLTDRVRAAALDHGLLIYGRRTNDGVFGEWLMISPPLVVSGAEVDELLDKLDATLRSIRQTMPRKSKPEGGQSP